MDARGHHMWQPRPDTKEGRPRVFVAAGLGGQRTCADHRSARGSLGSMAHPGNMLRIHPGLQGEAALSISLSGATYFIEGYALAVGSLQAANWAKEHRATPPFLPRPTQTGALG